MKMSAKIWEQHVAAARQQKVSTKTYADQHGLSPSTLYYWHRTYALTAARNCGVKCSLPGMKPVTKAATTWVNNSVFHW